MLGLSTPGAEHYVFQGTPKKTLRNDRRGSMSSLLPAISTSDNKDEESSSIIFSEMQRLDVPPPCPTPFMECRKRAGSVPTVKYTLVRRIIDRREQCEKESSKTSNSFQAVAWTLKSDQVRALKVTWERLCDTPRSNCRGSTIKLALVHLRLFCFSTRHHGASV